MTEKQQCPCCGYVLSGRPGPDLDLVDSLTREITFLRQTVAELRGSGAGRSIFPGARQPAETVAAQHDCACLYGARGA